MIQIADDQDLPAPAFNLAKFRVLLAIDHLNHKKIPATRFSIAIITGYKQETIQTYLQRYWPYLTARIARRCPDRCRTKYSLSAQGQRVLGRFHARFDNGVDLKLKATLPHQVDYSKVKILPEDFKKREEALKDLYGRYK